MSKTLTSEQLVDELNKAKDLGERMMNVAVYYQEAYHKLSDQVINLTLIPWWAFWVRRRIQKKIEDLLLEEMTRNPLKALSKIEEHHDES